MPQYLHGGKPVELKSRERMVRSWWGTCGREPAERETEHHLGIFDCFDCTIVVVTHSLARYNSLSRAKGMTNHAPAIYQTLPFCSFFQKVPFDMDFI